MLVFLKRGILIPIGARCCPEHVYKRQLNFDSLSLIRANQVDQLVCDVKHLEEILKDCRLILEKQQTFDFDDPCSLEDKDYYNITGLHKGNLNLNIISCYRNLLHHVLDQFDSVVARIKSMRTSYIRSIRIAVATFCAKMRLGLSNRVLSTLFHIKDERVVSRIIHQVTNALIKDFVPAYLGFDHISRESVLNYHQTAIANVLFTDNEDQVVLVMDGTYLYVQNSSHNELQRRTFSTHKHRHLIKPMIITTTVRILFL